jgi:uncharacterized protein YraI
MLQTLAGIRNSLYIALLLVTTLATGAYLNSLWRAGSDLRQSIGSYTSASVQSPSGSSPEVAQTGSAQNASQFVTTATQPGQTANQAANQAVNVGPATDLSVLPASAVNSQAANPASAVHVSFSASTDSNGAPQISAQAVAGNKQVSAGVSQNGQKVQMDGPSDSLTELQVQGDADAVVRAHGESGATVNINAPQQKSLTATIQDSSSPNLFSGNANTIVTGQAPQVQPLTGNPPLSQTEPYVVISGSQINVRFGPGTQYPVIASATLGQQYRIVARNPAGDWWQVCCFNGQQNGWVFSALVTPMNLPGSAQTGASTGTSVTPAPATSYAPPAPAAGVPVVAIAPSEPVGLTPAIATVAIAPQTTAPSTSNSAPPFILTGREQFREAILPRIFAYITSADGKQVLEGYGLRVMKDGSALPVNVRSEELPGWTWPTNEEGRQRPRNLKVEFPGIESAGLWEVYLTDPSGAIVSAPAVFNLKLDEQSQEMYVYFRKS